MSNGKSQAMRERAMELTVGGFFFLALAILATFTVVLRKDLLWKNVHVRKAHFTDIGGMKEGDKVLFRGMQIGKVAGASVVNGGDRIELELQLNDMPKLYEDYVVEIRNSSVLGGQYVQIEPGSEDLPVFPDDAILDGQSPVDVFKQAASFFGKLEEQDLVGTLTRSAENLETITTDLKEGRGTLHKLIHDDSLYEEARTVVTDAKEALKTVKDAGAKAGDAIEGLKEAGESVKAAGASVQTMSDNINEAVADARSGKGTLGKFMNDETLYTDLKSAVGDISGAAKKLSSGDSTLAKLANDEGALYNQVDGAFAEIKTAAESFKDTSAAFKDTAETARAVAARIDAGEGTLGKLVQDPALYDEAKATLKEVKAAVGDFREQAPITTFGTFVFGAF